MKVLTLVLMLMGVGLTYTSVAAEPLISQSSTDTVTIRKSTLGRAQNLARQAAEQANGGLTKYRAEQTMFGPPQDAPFVEKEKGWTFTFKGGAPTAEPTIETVVTVAYDFSSVIVQYNGPIR